METIAELANAILNFAIQNIDACKLNIVPPHCEKDLITKLLDKTKKAFEKDGQVVQIKGKFTVVGDLHGHILDLARIIQKNGPPPKTKYIFLGDLIDRGDFSIEVTTLVYTWKVLYPENVYIIRGNHEFPSQCREAGFFKEVTNYFKGTDMFDQYCQVFSYTPLAAILNDEILCVHGGIGPDFQHISDISKIAYPLLDTNGGLVDQLVWSDPVSSIDDFEESERGTGYFYGRAATSAFLAANKLKGIIRGHTPVQNGVQVHFDGLIYTVHSASWMAAKEVNQSGCIVVEEGKEPEQQIYEPLRHPRRSSDHHLKMSTSAPFFKTGSMKPGSLVPRRGSIVRNSNANLKFG